MRRFRRVAPGDPREDSADKITDGPGVSQPAEPDGRSDSRESGQHADDLVDGLWGETIEAALDRGAGGSDLATVVDPVEADEPPRHEESPAARRPWWHTALRIAALVVLAAVVISLLRGKLPSPAEFWQALITANPWWVLACAVLQIASIGMFARQQRRLLRAFGVNLSMARVGAITYSATAIANSFPAGGAVSAGWSFRQFKARGASSATAVTVALLSGVLSILGLVLLYLVGLLAATWTRLLTLAENHPGWTVTIGVVLLVVLVGLIRFIADRTDLAREDAPTPKLDNYQAAHPKLGAALRQVLTTLRQARKVSFIDWNLALIFTLAKWLLDAASLYAACEAFGIRINFLQLSAVYLGMQLIRQLPLTPGGIGVIEVALLAALVSGGAPEAAAAAAVLVYRLFSAWLVIPIGYLAMAAMARWDRRHIPRRAAAA